MNDEILESIRACAEAPERAFRVAIRPYVRPHPPFGSGNQFIAMLKPEALDVRSGVDVLRVLRLVDRHMEAFGVDRGACTVLSGAEMRLGRHVERHYGFLNRVARDGVAALAPRAARRLRRWVEGLGLEPRAVLGAQEVLRIYPGFTPRSLEALQRNAETVKLGAGVYANCARLNGEFVIILNAFHPYQVEHFCKAGNAIVVFECRSSAKIRRIRRDLIGPTDPAVAAPGTLKHALLAGAEELRLREVSVAFNGVHVSPGPVEAMFGVLRYFSGPSSPMAPERTMLGALLRDAGWDSSSILSLEDRHVPWDGDEMPLLEATENMDTEEAIAFLEAAARLGQGRS